MDEELSLLPDGDREITEADKEKALKAGDEAAAAESVVVDDEEDATTSNICCYIQYKCVLSNS